MSASVVLQEIIVRCCVRTGFALVSFLASMQTHMMSFKITFVRTFEHTYFALVNTAFSTEPLVKIVKLSFLVVGIHVEIS